MQSPAEDPQLLAIQQGISRLDRELSEWKRRALTAEARAKVWESALRRSSTAHLRITLRAWSAMAKARIARRHLRVVAQNPQLLDARGHALPERSLPRPY